MEQIKVLVVPTWYPNGADKLMGRYHQDFCHALNCDKRMKADMLYVDRQGLGSALSYFKMKKTFVDEYDNYKVYGRKMLDKSKFSSDIQIKSYTKTLLKLYEEYEKINGKPDVIHAQVSVPAGYACCILGEKIGVPVIMTEHSSYFERYFSGWESKYNKKVMDSVLVTCVGSFMLDTYKKYDVKAQVLPNVVECDKFSASKRKIAENRFNIVSVGALREGKCFDNVMDAVKILKDEIPNIHYTLIGDGELEDYFKSHCEKIGMNDYVSMVGRKNHTEIAEIFSDMDALVVSSDFETFGIPAVEAMAAGLPVVSTRNYGTEMFLNDETGYFCDINDVEDLTSAIRKMYYNKDNFSQNRLKEIASTYDGTKVAALAYDYYKQIMK